MDSRMLEQLEPGRLVMWGSAAWDQTQLTPGVSTLAAPRQTFSMRAKETTRVNWAYALRLVAVVIAWAGLLASLFLLYEEPLFGVLGILGSMALLLSSLAKIFEKTLHAAISIEN